MKKTLILLIMLAVAAGAIIVLGGFPLDLPVGYPGAGEKKDRHGEELNAEAVEHLASGRPVDAAALLREAALREPENPVIRRNLSIALAREAWEPPGGTENATALLDESLGLWPGNPEALDGLSTLNYRAGRYEEALEYARKLREILPQRDDLAAYVGHLEKLVASREGMVAEEGDNFRLYYSSGRKLEYEGEILTLLQTELDSLTAAFGIFPTRPVDVLILTEDLGARADPFDPAVEGLYDGQIRLYLGEGISDRERLVITVRHEMVHALLHRAAGLLPSWVQEGLAQKVGEEPSPERMETVRSFLAGEARKGYVIDLGELEDSFISMEPGRRSRSYAVSLLLMDYLEREHGSSVIALFVSELADGKDPVRAVESLTGLGITELERSLMRELGGRVTGSGKDSNAH